MNDCLLCEKPIVVNLSWKTLIGIDAHTIICVDCSKSFKRADIITEDKRLDQVTSLFVYNEAMRDYLHQFKFLQDIALARVFADDIRSVVKGKPNIVPIPMHPDKKIVRTFAHIEELLTSANVPYIDILEKTNSESMGEKTRAERLATAPLFKLKPNTKVKRETYTLIDDIYTTGTTLQHAAAALKQAGATRVEAITLIRAGVK